MWYLDYDDDKYHSAEWLSAEAPGDKWKSSTSGIDCDDTKPQYTTVCCEKTCESGYKLNEDNCECIMLLPCFGSARDMSSIQNPEIVDQVGNILNTLGIAGDTKVAVLELAKGNLGQMTNYVTYLQNLGKGLAVGSASISLTTYYNNPTTQNLLQVLFDSGVAALSFTPASPFISFAASFSNASGATSYVLENLANLIDRSIDCSVGQGIRNGLPY
jgi:hypothetical protein